MSERQLINDPKPLTRQALFRRIYADPWVIALQLMLTGVIVADYFLTNRLLSDSTTWYVLAGAILLALFLAPALHLAKLARLYMVITVFHLIATYFFIFVAPIGSPYDLIYVILIYISIYWYGRTGLSLSCATSISIMTVAVWRQSSFEHADDVYRLLINSLLLVIIGGIMERTRSADMVERRQLITVSREVSFERQRLRSLINSMADAVIATDYDGVVLVYNGAALDLLNTNLTLENRPLNQLLKTYDKSHRAQDVLAQARNSQTIVKRDDLLLEVGKEEYLNLYISVAQIHLGYGERGEEGFILLLRDITKEKSIEEQRDEFISVVSHELRTPIAITEANLSTALLPSIFEDSDKAKDLLEQAHKNILFLADLVNDITTLAHAERGDIDAQIEDVDPAALVKDVAEAYQEPAAKKGLRILTDIGSDLPEIKSNNYRLKEILQDYVTNAIKYTEKGSITIGVSRSDNGLRFSVTDTGIGLSQSDVHHVFDKFWRSEDFRTREHNGTGLGLYIAKKLAERMKGEVGVISKLNYGSTFYLDIPREISAPHDRATLR